MEQVIPVDVIDRSAQQAAEEGAPISACPYPAESSAAHRWHIKYHAHAKEICEFATT